MSSYSFAEPNKKCRLNLSAFAAEIVKNDMFTFDESKTSTFFNRIIENYHQEAQASISRRVQETQDQLEELLDDLPISPSSKEAVVLQLIANKKAILSAYAKDLQKEKGVHFSIWLNKNNMDTIGMDLSSCPDEREYYTSTSKYLKCVFEEYAKLPYVDRERIYFAQEIKKIETAIGLHSDQKKRCQIKIHTGRKEYMVYPYKIMRDPLSIANYLVGYSTEIDGLKDSKVPCSFRISAIKNFTVLSSKSAYLKATDITYLEKCIQQKGPQFLIGQDSEVKVKLSPNGINKYNRQLHLRPQKVDVLDENIYIFNCTLDQAEFYFFKFGGDAEIISPPELRNKLKRMYGSAFSNYSQSQYEMKK